MKNYTLEELQNAFLHSAQENKSKVQIETTHPSLTGEDRISLYYRINVTEKQIEDLHPNSDNGDFFRERIKQLNSEFELSLAKINNKIYSYRSRFSILLVLWIMTALFQAYLLFSNWGK